MTAATGRARAAWSWVRGAAAVAALSLFAAFAARTGEDALTLIVALFVLAARAQLNGSPGPQNETHLRRGNTPKPERQGNG